MNKKSLILLQPILLVCLVIYLLVTLSYSRKQWNKVICRQIEVNILDRNVNKFLDKEDVERALKVGNLNYFGEKVSELPIDNMEKLLSRNNLIKTANVYATLDGTLHVDITQRNPVLRIYADNYNFYIDYDGYILQPVNLYASYVPVVNGKLKIPFEKDFSGNMFTFFKEREATDSTLISLYEFGKYINNHPFWNAQIEQIYFVKRQQVELIPRVGAHIIKLGTLDNYEYKLRKLYALYQKGFPLKGWNTYETIDLSYSNQIICKKK